ncbi:MAG: hypothetical protein KDE55_14820 [Novosphingobium sp.]|nr:hypothetical protein [Novosphingobium sp.]
MADSTQSGRCAGATPTRRPTFEEWSEAFLSELASTSNVTASARKAGVSTSVAYEARRQNRDFNRKWREALCEGYDHLEMDLLHRLRKGELKPAPGTKRSVRTFDNAIAFRLLLAHRETAAQERAIRENQDADAVLASINDKLDRMRERALKAARSEDDAQ